ncbi:MAG: hypothetical protein A2Z15_03485 [Chloroflexi bacterium RBG_16_50_11]|nr:MAG: hypothetical protein A2Z15_03485 [Chloroflexi bacterium RBG_16_50_11]
MTDWRKQLKHDPVPVLLSSQNKAIVYFTKRDLLNEPVEPISFIWGLPEPQKLIRKQQADGSWKKSGGNPAVYPPNHSSLVETFKQFRILVERYQFTKDHPLISKAAEFLFTFQTKEGDIRGFIGNQYATYYTGYVLSLLIRAGYEADPRVEKGIKWLLSMRQNDGAWTVPFTTHEYDREMWLKLTSKYMESLAPDRTKPFSHNATDMVLRAFAAHAKYRNSKEAKAAGVLLKSRFFKPDAYTSYQSPKYWTRFAFWWPNLLTALNYLSLLGFTKDDPDIKRGLNWFIDNQQKDALWKLESTKAVSTKDTEERLWLGLNICRMLKRYFG